MSNDVFKKVNVQPVVEDREIIIRLLIQMGADERLFNNPSPEIGKRIIDRVLWILGRKNIDIRKLTQLMPEQLGLDATELGATDDSSCCVLVNPKTRAIILEENMGKRKATKEFKVDENGHVCKHTRATEEGKEEEESFSRRYDENGIMMVNKVKKKTNGKGNTMTSWKRDEEYPFIAVVQEKINGIVKQKYILLNLYELHDITSSEKERDNNGCPMNDKPIVFENRTSIDTYYREQRKEIQAAFSGSYKSPKSLSEDPYHKGLVAIARKAGILEPEKAKLEP